MIFADKKGCVPHYLRVLSQNESYMLLLCVYNSKFILQYHTQKDFSLARQKSFMCRRTKFWGTVPPVPSSPPLVTPLKAFYQEKRSKEQNNALVSPENLR